MGIYFRLGAPVGLAVLLFLLLLQAAGRGEVGLALICVAGIGVNVSTVLLALRTERRREQRRRIAEEEMLAEIAQWKMRSDELRKLTDSLGVIRGLPSEADTQTAGPAGRAAGPARADARRSRMAREH